MDKKETETPEQTHAEPEETHAEPEETPKPDPVQPPHSDDLSQIVHGLSERLSTVEGVIAGLASGEGHSEKDETPVKVPWTHRKFG